MDGREATTVSTSQTRKGQRQILIIVRGERDTFTLCMMAACCRYIIQHLPRRRTSFCPKRVKKKKTREGGQGVSFGLGAKPGRSTTCIFGPHTPLTRDYFFPSLLSVRLTDWMLSIDSFKAKELYKLNTVWSKYTEELEFIYTLDMGTLSYYPLKAMALMNGKATPSLKALFITHSIGILRECVYVSSMTAHFHSSPSGLHSVYKIKNYSRDTFHSFQNPFSLPLSPQPISWLPLSSQPQYCNNAFKSDGAY